MSQNTGIEPDGSSRRSTGRGRRAWAGVWRLSDPKITLASAASMFLGASAAAGRLFAVIIAVAFSGVLLLPAAGLPLTTWLGLAGLPHGAAAARRLLRDDTATAEIIPAQGWTLLAFVLSALGSGVGLLLAGL